MYSFIKSLSTELEFLFFSERFSTLGKEKSDSINNNNKRTE